MSKLRLISWNVNGIRAVYNKGALLRIFENDPDFVCIQETKANEDQLSFDIKIIQDYISYFSSAERKGYSGVAVYVKEKALKVDNKIGEEGFDNEGRSLILEYPEFYLLNIYFPNGQKSKQRVEFKLEYYEHFLKLIKRLERTGKMIIICGDVNTAHNEIDLARPKENSKTSGFLPSERAFLDKLINNGYIDTFRHFNKEPNNYTWWDLKSKARERNVGWRIDYFFIDKAHIKNLIDAGIMSDVKGSDHAPVFIDIEL